MNAHGFATTLTEIKGHTHNYYGAAARINQQVWDFLKAHKLAAEPKFQPYQILK
jgi:hypothetical protein